MLGGGCVCVRACVVHWQILSKEEGRALGMRVAATQQRQEDSSEKDDGQGKDKQREEKKEKRDAEAQEKESAQRFDSYYRSDLDDLLGDLMR